MKGAKKRTSEPRRTANEEELAGARVDPDHAAPAYDGHAVLQGEALVSEDEEEASLRKLRKRDQPSLARLALEHGMALVGGRRVVRVDASHRS